MNSPDPLVQVFATARRERFSPGALRRALARVSSLAAASLAVPRRRAEALVTVAVSLALLGATAIRALPRGGALPVLGAFAGWLLLALLVGLLLSTEAESPRPGLGLDNVLTAGRALGTPAVALSGLADPSGLLTASLVALGLVTDVIDGRWARLRGSTRFGRLADPVADGLFFSLAMIALIGPAGLPAWLAAVVALRYGLPVAAGAVLFLRRTVPIAVGHTIWGQASTASIGLAMIVAMASRHFAGAGRVSAVPGLVLTVLEGLIPPLAVMALVGAARRRPPSALR